MDKLRMQSFDKTGDNIKKIASLFPQCVTERMGKDGKPELAIDFEKLKNELSGEVIDEGEERYQFTWPGKRVASRLANKTTTQTLRPCREESVDFDHTQHLYIEGDNLEVLKLLRETYLGKIKMIYIDPPYNTGNDFVYHDSFAQGKAEFEQKSSLFDDEGNQTIDPMQRNTESNGRFHTDWLNMMYPRLKVARDLLSDDGVIFISIDDHEIENLKEICNEIFGENNRLVNGIWVSGRTAASHFTNSHEYILGYAKSLVNLPLFKYHGNKGTISDRAIKKIGIKNPASEIDFPAGIDFESKDKIFPRIFGTSEVVEVTKGVLECRDGKLKNPVKIKAGWAMKDMIINWLNGKTVYDQKGQLIKRFFFKQNGVLQYEKDKGTIHPNSVITEFSTKQGSNEIENLFGISVFSYPKPIELIKYLSVILVENDIFLDFFSGSATSAHAIMQMNFEDKKNCRYISVQLKEPTPKDSEAYKAGYMNICEIGKERIRRAGKKIKEDNKDKEGIEKLDTGFRVLKLDSSNMNDVYYTPEEFSQYTLFSENVKQDRTSEDLLFQVMLDLGIELSARIEKHQIAGKEIYLVDGNYLVACFDSDVDETAITEMAKMRPVYFVMRDSSRASDSVADNFEQLFKCYSPDTICKVL